MNPKDRVSNFKKYINSGRILEIVSVQGLDALELKSQGFKFIPCDFVGIFINILKTRNFTPAKINLKKYSIEEFTNLDGVYANAFFVHFRKKTLWKY